MSHKAAIVPSATVRYYPNGEHCTDPMIGDLVLVRSGDIGAKFIRFGEKLRLWLTKQDTAYGNVNHAMTVVSTYPYPQVQQMTGSGGVVTPLQSYTALEYAVVHITDVTIAERLLAARAALWYLDVPYGWSSIGGDAFYCLTGLRLGLSTGQSVVCSADACSAQRCLGLVPDKPDVAVLPSDLARYFDVKVPA